MTITIDKIVEEIIVKSTGEVVVVEQAQTKETVQRIRIVPGPIDPEDPEAEPTNIEETYDETTVIATGYARRIIKPGDSTLEEDVRVQEVCALVHTEEFLGYPVQQADDDRWNIFNEYMLTEPNFAAYTATVGQTSRYLPAYLSDAYSMVAKSGVRAFRPLYSLFCTIGEVTQVHKDLWADKAAELDLSIEFVGILRGIVYSNN
jgi:hypothetical protein